MESARAGCFKEFWYRTRESWSRKRRVIGKAEWLEKGANPRYVVTSLSRQQMETRAVYEELYWARGDMENRIKEQQLKDLDLTGERVSPRGAVYPGLSESASGFRRARLKSPPSQMNNAADATGPQVQPAR